MRALGKLSVILGIVSLIIGIGSRWFIEPIQGIEAHAFLSFSQACFLLGIAAFHWDSK